VTGRVSTMPAACCSGQARHAVATQVERGVRQHRADFCVDSRDFARKACHSKTDYASCCKPDRLSGALNSLDSQARTLCEPLFFCLRTEQHLTSHSKLGQLSLTAKALPLRQLFISLGADR
jgi:hypothetical protein